MKAKRATSEEEKRVQLSLKVKPDVYQKVSDIAQELGTTKSILVENALKRFLVLE